MSYEFKLTERVIIWAKTTLGFLKFASEIGKVCMGRLDPRDLNYLSASYFLLRSFIQTGEIDMFRNTTNLHKELWIQTSVLAPCRTEGLDDKWTELPQEIKLFLIKHKIKIINPLSYFNGGSDCVFMYLGKYWQADLAIDNLLRDSRFDDQQRIELTSIIGGLNKKRIHSSVETASGVVDISSKSHHAVLFQPLKEEDDSKKNLAVKISAKKYS